MHFFSGFNTQKFLLHELVLFHLDPLHFRVFPTIVKALEDFEERYAFSWVVVDGQIVGWLWMAPGEMACHHLAMAACVFRFFLSNFCMLLFYWIVVHILLLKLWVNYHSKNQLDDVLVTFICILVWTSVLTRICCYIVNVLLHHNHRGGIWVGSLCTDIYLLFLLCDSSLSCGGHCNTR